jgi:hypothetical protein
MPKVSLRLQNHTPQFDWHFEPPPLSQKYARDKMNKSDLAAPLLSNYNQIQTI